MITGLVLFTVGVVLLLFSSELLVKLSSKLSQVLRISPLIVGITVVAIGTSLPELTVSSLAVFQNDAGLALGNIVGSNIINVLLVFALAVIIKPLRVGSHKTQTSSFMLLLATLVFLSLHLFNLANLVNGLILLALALFVLIFDYHQGALGRRHEDARYFKNFKSEKISLKDITLLITSLIGIIIGGLLVVFTIETFSQQTGISTTMLGLSITAFVTSLPELFTVIISEEKHQEKIALGSIIGSNTYNLLLIGGLISLFSSQNTIPLFDWLVLSLSTLGFFIILKFYHGRLIPRWIGFVLLIFCLLYLLTLKR
jgi:cation:H+ antiporter